MEYESSFVAQSRTCVYSHRYFLERQTKKHRRRLINEIKRAHKMRRKSYLFARMHRKRSTTQFKEINPNDFQFFSLSPIQNKLKYSLTFLDIVHVVGEIKNKSCHIVSIYRRLHLLRLWVKFLISTHTKEEERRRATKSNRIFFIASTCWYRGANVF